MSETEFYYILCVVFGFMAGCFFTLCIYLQWRAWECKFLGHVWAYAEGRGKGALTGGIRPLCFRRACTRCGKIQEISHFQWGSPYVGVDGIEYKQNPIWIDPTKEDAA